MNTRTITFNENGNIIRVLVDPVGVFIQYWVGTKLMY